MTAGAAGDEVADRGRHIFEQLIVDVMQRPLDETTTKLEPMLEESARFITKDLARRVNAAADDLSRKTSAAERAILETASRNQKDLLDVLGQVCALVRLEADRFDVLKAELNDYLDALEGSRQALERIDQELRAETREIRQEQVAQAGELRRNRDALEASQHALAGMHQELRAETRKIREEQMAHTGELQKNRTRELIILGLLSVLTVFVTVAVTVLILA